MTVRKIVVGAASAALAAALFVSGVRAQAIIQAGPATSGHLLQYFNQGTSQAIVGDGGGSGGGVTGANLGELGVTSRYGKGDNTPPFVGNGNGPNGEHFCMYDAPTSNLTGYHALCLDPQSTINGSPSGIMSFAAFGGAPQIPLIFYLNGTVADLSSIGSVTVGTTQIKNATDGSVLYDNAGLLGNFPLGPGVMTSLAHQVNADGGIATFPIMDGAIGDTLGVGVGGTGNGHFNLNAPIFGGGFSAPLVQGTTSGPGTIVATVSGSPVNGHCASWNASGNIIDAGGACTTGGGGGTVTSGTIGQIALYAATGTVVSGSSTIPFGSGGQTCQTLEANGGGVGASASANTAAWNTILAGLSAPGGCIQFGPGTYSVQPLNMIFPTGAFGIGVYGAGKQVTTLNFGNNTGGLTFQYRDAQNSVDARDFTVETTNTTGGGGAFTITSNVTTGLTLKKSIFSNIETIGTSSGYWTIAYDVSDVTGVVIQNPTINGFGASAPAGAGVLCEGLSATQYTTGLSVINGLFDGATIAVQFGDYCQGLAVINPTIRNGTTGVFSASSPSGNETGLQVLGGTIAQETGYGVQLLGSIDNVIVSGVNVAVAASQHGIDVGIAVGGALTGNTVSCSSLTSTAGIATSGFELAITGNLMQSCGAGLLLYGGAGSDIIQSNVYSGNTNMAVSTSATANRFGSCVGVSGACTAGASP